MGGGGMRMGGEGEGVGVVVLPEKRLRQGGGEEGGRG